MTADSPPERKLVCFDLAGRELGANIDEVRETIGMRPITPIFNTPTCIAGLINLRGEILAVLDVGVLLGGTPSRRDPHCRIVVIDVKTDGQERSAGLLVDGLGPIRDVPLSAIAPPPATLPIAESAIMHGIVSLPSHPLAVLDLGRILAAPELAPFAEPTDFSAAASSKSSTSKGMDNR